ncbi:ser/Thr protein phosphatase family protein [Dactylonectria macrodidyma]|uniref:Ser/Thr protein phosphatase family protein n=1 Tax=Dactylonectria macrodidyma TaxID=307937 RepID=A0A9P9DVE9_9HYPO|nr:ser/Thr protein phosphatase family protein [Dactylonectria macrodidyma]
MKTPANQPKARKVVLRRTRFVLISDTHNCTPHLPRGDVLIHAGDITNRGTHLELSRAIQWLEKADFEAKIIIAGNHDVTLDADFYSRIGHVLHAAKPQNPQACLDLLTSSPSLTYLNHTSKQIALTSPSGPRTTFKLFGSPFSPQLPSRDTPFAAFTYPSQPLSGDVSSPTTQSPAELPTLWDAIPLDTDVVVTHTPARTHVDGVAECYPYGCEALRRTLWRVRPRLAVCGHVHQARGVERVTWDLRCGDIAFKEAGVVGWDDPGQKGNKMSIVNLGAKGGRPLRNDGSSGTGSSLRETAPDSTGHSRASDLDARLAIGALGHGGPDPSSVSCDTAALRGRMKREETCFINCSIMTKSHFEVGTKGMNKPIVVDLDLPAWGEEEDDSAILLGVPGDS